MSAIDTFFYVVGIDWPEITRPTATRIKLGIGFEQGCSATDASINTMLVMIPKLTAKGAFRIAFTGDGILFFTQQGAPFGFGLSDFICYFIDAHIHAPQDEQLTSR